MDRYSQMSGAGGTASSSVRSAASANSPESLRGLVLQRFFGSQPVSSPHLNQLDDDGIESSREQHDSKDSIGQVELTQHGSRKAVATLRIRRVQVFSLVK